MVEGKNGNVSVILCASHNCARVKRCRHKVSLRKHNALACARRAGRKEYCAGLVKVDLVIFRRSVAVFICFFAELKEIGKAHESFVLREIVSGIIKADEIFNVGKFVLCAINLVMYG